MGRKYDVGDISGQVFGKLTAIREYPKDARKGQMWVFRCSCDGNERPYVLSKVIKGASRSCGCVRADIARRVGKLSQGAISHGRSKTPEYAVWKTMKQRCSVRATGHAYEDYYIRGICVCDRWKTSFVNFLEDVGPRPGPEYSIDRIDNDGDYEPGNVKWSTDAEQRANKRPRRFWKRPQKDVGRGEREKCHAN